MKFLFPTFLFGLIALIIPLIIHLFHLKRTVRVFFSNVQFLKNIQKSESSRRKLRQWIIMSIRMLALAFLVLSFAKPYVPASGDDLNRQHAISIFVDNSYSMEAINKEGSLLDQARNRAKELASGYGLNDKFQLLTQDFEGSHQRLLSRQEFYDEVDKIKISPHSRTLSEIINRQKNLLDMQQGMLKKIYIISDFQKNLLPEKAGKVTSDISVNLIRLKATSLPNVTIDSAWLASAVHAPGQSEKLIVTLHNYADQKAEKIPVKFLVNGKQKALGSFSVGPRSIQNDTLSFSGLEAGWQNAEIQVQDNPITFDNSFYLTFRVSPRMPVLLIDGGTPNKYLTTVFSTDSFFTPLESSYGNVDYAKLPTFPLVVLSDILSIPPGLAQQLQSYVKNGGTMAVFPSDKADLASYQALLKPIGASYPDGLVTSTERVERINLQSKLFENTFEDIPKQPDLPLVQKYYRLSTDNQAVEEKLFELPGHLSFFSDYPAGDGRVYLSAVPLNTDYSNLPLHALFVPLMYRMALLSGHDLPLFYTIDRDEGIEMPRIQTSDRAPVKLLGPGPAIIPDVIQEGTGTWLYFSDQIKTPGTYKLVNSDSVAAQLAFNNSRSESDLSYLSDKQLRENIPGKNNQVIPATASTMKFGISEARHGPELWKLCLILALICLAVEIVLTRYLPAERQNEIVATE